MTCQRLAIAAIVCLLTPLLALVADDSPGKDSTSPPIEALPTDRSLAKIVLIAGFPNPKLKSGEHEYFAGCAVLSKLLQQSKGVFPVLVRDGWPKNPETLKGAKAVVLFLEGGDAHALLKEDRLQQLQELARQGTGVVHLHSAIDYPKDLGGRVREVAGAAWEKGLSQRAHWVASFDEFPDHPIFRGVAPFKIDDGWLWKLRFVDGRKGITPLLRTVSPKDGGKTSPDDAVVAWAFERPGGGRSFSFTGCHLHESLKLEGYRRFLVNGILWSAGIETPRGGAPVELAPVELQKHLDPKPKKAR